MLYRIPVGKIRDLEKIAIRIQKKGGQVTLLDLGEVECMGTLTIRDPNSNTYSTMPVKVRCREIEVSGSYRINGWEFVGTIEHTPNGNIIRLANSKFEGLIPERYNHTELVCEHCGTKRFRKDVYLIHNSETGEYKQVGRSCLLDYTGGLDAEICASIMSNIDIIETLQDYDCDYNTFCGMSDYGVPSKIVKEYAIALVKKFGYFKTDSEKATVNDLRDLLFFNSKDNQRIKDIKPDDSLINEIIEYAKSITDTYGYMYNAKVAWLNDSAEFRDFGLIASFVGVYLREKEKQATQKQESQYIGTPGDKIEFEVSDVKQISYNYQWETYFYSIKDTNGNVYIWSTSKVVVAGDHITATVKSHEEYRGVKQTVITRGKVI